MKVVETSISIGQSGNETAADLIATIGTAANRHTGEGKQVVRFVVTGRKGRDFSCELGVFEAPAPATTPDLFAFRPRAGRDDREFNAVFLVPTGIGAEIGGHSGDSGPVGKLLAAACDHLITHPNVGNAADINELPPNTFYVEGSVIADLLMGNVELQPVRANRLILLMERHTDPWFMDATVNMASAARAAEGEPLSLQDDKFRIYTIEWDEKEVRFFIDGVQQHIIEDKVPDRPARVIFGLRQMPWAGRADWTEPQTMTVDWVSVEPLP